MNSPMKEAAVRWARKQKPDTLTKPGVVWDAAWKAALEYAAEIVDNAKYAGVRIFEPGAFAHFERMHNKGKKNDTRKTKL